MQIKQDRSMAGLVAFMFTIAHKFLILVFEIFVLTFLEAFFSKIIFVVAL